MAICLDVLLRHLSTLLVTSDEFRDLRSASRKDKEAHFEKEVQLLAPIARQALTEMNTSLLLDTYCA